jgi:hypothetical protein
LVVRGGGVLGVNSLQKMELTTANTMKTTFISFVPATRHKLNVIR